MNGGAGEPASGGPGSRSVSGVQAGSSVAYLAGALIMLVSCSHVRSPMVVGGRHRASSDALPTPWRPGDALSFCGSKRSWWRRPAAPACSGVPYAELGAGWELAVRYPVGSETITIRDLLFPSLRLPYSIAQLGPLQLLPGRSLLGRNAKGMNAMRICCCGSPTACITKLY